MRTSVLSSFPIHQLLRLLHVGFALVACHVTHAQNTDVAGTLPEDLLPSLRPILVHAVSQAPQMLLANTTIAQAEAGRYQANSNLWPQLSANASYADRRSAVEDNSSKVSSTSDGIFYGTNISQPIFHWGALKAQADIAKLQLEIAKQSYAEAYRLLAVSLRSQYLLLVAKKMALRNQQYQLRLIEANVAVAEEKLKAGTISPGEMIGPRLALDEARLALERAETDYHFSRGLIARLAGLKDVPDETVPSTVPSPVYSEEKTQAALNDFLRRGAEDTFQGRVYAANVRQQNLTYKIARTGLLPKFSANAGYSLDNSTSASATSISQVAVSSTSYSIGASWTIFDGFRTRGAKLSALANKRYYERLLAQYNEQTIAQAESLSKQVALAARSVSLANQRSELGAAGVQRSKEEFALGNIAQSAVEGMQTAANSSELNALQARSDYLNRWSEFLSVLCVDPILEHVQLPSSRRTDHGK